MWTGISFVAVAAAEPSLRHGILVFGLQRTAGEAMSDTSSDDLLARLDAEAEAGAGFFS